LEEEWVKTVLDQFISSFNHYKRKLSCSFENSSTTASTVTTPVVQEAKGIYSKYKSKKRRRIPADNYVEEYTKYFTESLAVDGTNVLQFWKANPFFIT
jgi:hypothetical protein